jgi:hypothetical protein
VSPATASITRRTASRVLVAFGIAALAACGRSDDGAATQGKTGGSGGAGGSGGSSAGSGGSAGEDLRAVAAVLDGFLMTQPCVSSSGPRSCRTHPEGACPKNADPMLAGATPTRETLSLGGRAGTFYDVVLRVQGIVEPKVYRGGTDVSELVTDGFQRAGTVDNAKGQHSTFVMKITAPPGSYFLNSLGKQNLRHSVFAVDYEATVPIQGGSSFEVLVSDPNCQALKNCGDPDVPTECAPVDIPDLEPKIREKLGKNPRDYDGQFLGFVVKSVVARAR